MTAQPSLTAVSPGMFFVTHIKGWVGNAIAAMEELDDFSDLRLNVFSHAGIYLGDGKTIEAEVGKQGAITGNISRYMDGRPLLFSSKLAIDQATLDRVAAEAVKFKGVRYSFLDYGAIAVKRLHIPVPGLTRYIDSTGRMICSQLVARAYYNAGRPLFGSEWSGDVTPKMLARLVA